jgi:hypothetical protein
VITNITRGSEMRKETKTFLKEDEDDDVYQKGDEISFKKMKGIVTYTSHYIIMAEFIIMSWKEKLMRFIKRGK